MTRLLPPAALAALLAAALGLTACGEGGGAASTAASTRPSAPVQSPGAKADEDKAAREAARLPAAVIASVGGVPITRAEFRRLYAQTAAQGGIPLDPPLYARCTAALRRQQAQLRARLGALNARLAKEDRRRGASASKPLPMAPPSRVGPKRQCAQHQAALLQSSVSQLIQARWTEQRAKAAHVGVTDAEVAAAVASQRKALGGTVRWNAYLNRTGQDEAQIQQRTRLQLLSQKLQARLSAGAPQVSEAQVERFFAQHSAEFALPARQLPNGKTSPAVKPQLAPYRQRIRLLLQSQITARRVARYTSAEQQRLRDMTLCRSGYVVALCANARG